MSKQDSLNLAKCHENKVHQMPLLALVRCSLKYQALVLGAQIWVMMGWMEAQTGVAVAYTLILVTSEEKKIQK